MKHYVTAIENDETITQGKSYRLLALINDFYIIVDNNGENVIKHSSLFGKIEWNKKSEENAMLRYGRNFEISNELMNTIATYMLDDTREQVHSELAPCTPEKFLKRYIELDPNFEELIYKEFGIEMEE